MLTRRALLAGGAALALVRAALAGGRLEKGIYRVRGDARLNGAPARVGMDVKAGDAISTGADGELVFVIERDAVLVRANTRLDVAGRLGELAMSGLRILTGAALSVFASGQPKRIQASTATIGIRGTAVYVENQPGRTYVCTCYGEAELTASDDPGAREIVRTRHHDQPRYVMAKGAPQMLMRAPVVNHTDAELILLESLVGREPPFVGTTTKRY